MTNKIYEYKDEQGWYVGSYGIFGGVRTVTDDDLDFPLLEVAQRFRDEDRGFPVSVTVLRYGSLYRLLSFVVDILNQEMGRNVEVIQRQGAIGMAIADTAQRERNISAHIFCTAHNARRQLTQRQCSRVTFF